MADKYYAVCRLFRTNQLYIGGTYGCETAEEARAEITRTQAVYGDFEVVRIIGAPNLDVAKTRLLGD